MLEVLLEEKHFTKASKRLNIAQPALSYTINKFRDFYKDKLLIKCSKHFELTEKGRNIYGKLKKINQDFQSLLVVDETFSPQDYRGTFNLGLCDHGTQLLLPLMYNRIFKDIENVRVNIVRVTQADVFQTLSSGVIDLAIGSYFAPPESLYSQKLFDCEPICMFSKQSLYNTLTFDLNMFLRAKKIFYGYGDFNEKSKLQKEFKRHQIDINAVISSPYMMGNLLTILTDDVLMITTNKYYELMRHFFPIAHASIPLVSLPCITVKQYWHEKQNKNASLFWLRQNIKRIISLDIAELK